MAVPDFQTFLLPTLELFSDGEQHVNREVYDHLFKRLRITDGDLKDLLPSGKKTRFHDRAQWSLVHLTAAGLLESVGRGSRKITERGGKVWKNRPERITVRYLTRFEEYRVFRGLEQRQDDDSAIDDSEDEREEHTPTDRLENAFQAAQDPLRAEVLEAVLKRDDKFFEQLVLDVLTAAGYGGRVEDEPSLHLGRTADGGVDGMIKEDPLGLDLIYVQAKRYKVGQNLDVKEIRAFSGSLDEFGSKKGVFVTTSDFTSPARDYAQRIGDKKIALINGRGLVDLMMKHRVGVRVEQVYELKAVDLDYFEP